MYEEQSRKHKILRSPEAASFPTYIYLVYVQHCASVGSVQFRIFTTIGRLDLSHLTFATVIDDKPCLPHLSA